MIHRMSRRKLYALIVALFAWQVTVGVLNLVYTNHVDQQWCGLLTTLDEGFSAPTPTPQTERSKRIAAAVHDRRVNAHC